MEHAFISPSLPLSSPRRRPRIIPKCSTPQPHQRPRMTRRAFLLSLLPLPALAFEELPDLDPQADTRRAIREETIDSLLHTPQQRYGITDHTYATHEDYLRASHVTNPPHALRTALARSSVVAFVAAFSAFGMAVSERESLRNPLPRLYDREAVDRYFSVRPDKVVKRMGLFAREITGFGVRWALDEAQAWFDCLSVKNGVRKTEWAYQRDDSRVRRRARLLREAITRLGTAVIKLGQAAASRQDLFGVGVVRELQKLQDDILEYFPTVEAFAVIEKELGARPQMLFEDISTMPVAGASLGMVFKARVDDTVVAVKVQRPEVAENVALDCYIVRWMASMATFLLRSRTDLGNAVDEYASRLFEELDYLNEVENMDKFRQLYGNVNGIYLPKVFPDYCSRRVLVTEWVDGVKLIDDDAKVRPEDIGLVKIGIRFALTQLLDKGFLHADMHNGNMLRTKSGNLAFIDFGLVSYVPASVRESIVCALMQLMHGEYTLLAQSFSGLALMNTDDIDVDLPHLSEALRTTLETSSKSEFTLIGMVSKLLTLGTRFRFTFNDYFLNNVRCLSMLEGLALAADAEFSMLQVVYPFVAEKLLSEHCSRYEKTLCCLMIDSYGRIRWNRMKRLLYDISPRHDDDDDDDGLMKYVMSRKGNFLRKYITNEIANDVFKKCVGRIDKMLSRPMKKITNREQVSKIENGIFGRDDYKSRMLILIRLLPGLITALLSTWLRIFEYGIRALLKESEKRKNGGIMIGEWRAFDSSFLRRCG